MSILIYSIFVITLTILALFVFKTRNFTVNSNSSNRNPNVIYCYGKQMYKRRRNKLRLSKTVRSKHK